MWAPVCWPCSSSAATGKHLKTKTPTGSRKIRFWWEFFLYSNRRPPGGALAPLCRVVPRAANRNKHDCRWQSYRYYAVMATPMTEGVYATDLLQAIVR